MSQLTITLNWETWLQPLLENFGHQCYWVSRTYHASPWSMEMNTQRDCRTWSAASSWSRPGLEERTTTLKLHVILDHAQTATFYLFVLHLWGPVASEHVSLAAGSSHMATLPWGAQEYQFKDTILESSLIPGLLPVCNVACKKYGSLVKLIM